MKMRTISKKEMEKIHPAIPDAYEKLEQGRISRREFIRFATLLGMSAATATMVLTFERGALPRCRSRSYSHFEALESLSLPLCVYCGGTTTRRS